MTKDLVVFWLSIYVLLSSYLQTIMMLTQLLVHHINGGAGNYMEYIVDYGTEIFDKYFIFNDWVRPFFFFEGQEKSVANPRTLATTLAFGS